MSNRLKDLIKEYKEKGATVSNVTQYSYEIIDILENEYGYDTENLKQMLTDLGCEPEYMDIDDEDELCWACVDYIESELLK